MTAYVVRREGYVLTRVCPSVCPRRGWGGTPGQVQAGGVPQLGGTPPRVPPGQTWLGGVPQLRGTHLRYPLIWPGQGVSWWGVPHLGYPLSDLAREVTWGGAPLGTPSSDLARGYPDGRVPHLGYPCWTWLGGTQLGGIPPQVPPHLTWPGGYMMGYPTSGTPYLTWPGDTMMGGTPPQVPPIWPGQGGTLMGCPPWVSLIRPGQGGTLMGGVPHLGYPCQTWLGGYHDRGTPSGTPYLTWPGGTLMGGAHLGCPLIGPGWGVPWWEGYPTLGTPIGPGWGVPWWGVPPSGTSPVRPGWGGTPTGWGRVPHLGSTWYAAVSMPLAFTQEDFRDNLVFAENSRNLNRKTENIRAFSQLQNVYHGIHVKTSKGTNHVKKVTKKATNIR